MNETSIFDRCGVEGRQANLVALVPLCIIGKQIHGKSIWLNHGLPERHEAMAVEGHRV